MTNVALAVVVSALAATGPVAAVAGEGAVSLYLPGYRSFYAGVVAAPGTYLNTDVFHYGGTLRQGSWELERSADVILPTVAHVTRVKVLGATYAFAARIPLAGADLHGIDRGRGASFAGASRAIGDLALTPLVLGWRRGEFALMATITAYVPTGAYRTSELVNIGRNHGGLDPAFAVTWIGSRSRFEISASAGMTFNFRNPATDYTNGHEAHVDMALIKHLPSGLGIGAIGYAFVQVTNDRGSGAAPGGGRGRVFALGPAARFDGRLAGSPVNASLRWYREFGAENRYQGDVVFLSAGVRL